MKLRHIAVCVSLAAVSASSFATNGYFSHGYGTKAKSMGGVGIALPQDALAAATNPAGMVMLGNRIDFGVDWFRPVRDAEITAPNPTAAKNDGNDTQSFIVPEFGYNRMLNTNLSLGVSVYGNGGMNTDYNNGIPLFGSTTRAGVDLMQLFIAPTIAYKLTPDHAIGLSVNLAYQRFEATGLQGFAASSASPANLTNNGHDSSTGMGIRIGYTGNISDRVTIGATYQSKTRMSKFSDYKGLFAEGGDFDIPENYGVGIAVKATPALTAAFDIEHIRYSDIASVSNPLQNLFAGNPIGSKNGPGFGWNDMTVYKLGVSYAYSKDLTLMAGWNHGKQPIPKSQTFFNILAPGVIEDHLTLGMTWTLANKSELTLSYVHAFSHKQKGSGSIPALPFGGGNADLKMYQDTLGVAYGWKM
jgi:long-chain fatty acid transport protein